MYIFLQLLDQEFEMKFHRLQKQANYLCTGKPRYNIHLQHGA